MSRRMWDGINSDAQTIKRLIQPGDLVAYYVDGYFAWTSDEIAMFPHNEHVTVTVIGNPADAADCETGDMTPVQGALWIVRQKAAGYQRPTIYRSFSVMQDIREATGVLVMGKDWDAWVADYDNDPDRDYAGEAAKQYKTTDGYDLSEVYDDAWPHRTAGPVVTSVNSPKWPSGQVLTKGNVGNAVLAMQAALGDSGIRGVRGITVDGKFGDQTLVALRNFQENEGLNVDGIAGPATRSDLINLGLLNSAGQAGN